MTRQRTIHVIDGGYMRLPCGTCIAWSTHRYGGSGKPIEYTTEIDISVEGNDVARIDATPADVSNNTVMSHTTIYGVEHKEPMEIASCDEYWKAVKEAIDPYPVSKASNDTVIW